MIVNNLYTSVGANRTPTSVNWGNNDLICFGACNSVAILNPTVDGSCKVIKTLAGHTARVNTVKWIKRAEHAMETEILSGSDDNDACYWDVSDLSKDPIKLVLHGHTGGVTFLDSIVSNGNLLVATTSVDSSVKLWIKKGEEFLCYQTISLKTGICFAVRFYQLPNDAGIILAFATDDDNIQLHGSDKENIFTKVETLSGHEDWVRGLDFTVEESSGDLLLASSSQDSFIRLWRISARSEGSQRKIVDPEDVLQIEERTFKVNNMKFALSLESVLQGHENWVYSVDWCKDKDTGALQLLSSSMDKSMIIWTLDVESGIWSEKVRVGEVGGNSLGFYGAKFRSNGKSIIGLGFQGSFHLWSQNSDNESLWEPGVIVSGHFKEVKDIGWEPEGEFLISISMDQTSRIHGAWKRDGHSDTYHEIARPQIHGYDMQCMAVLSRYKFASAAEEKIVRTFQAPGNFVENFRSLCKITVDPEGDELIKCIPKGAAVPSLGLSNKAVFDEDLVDKNNDIRFKDEYPEKYFVPMSLVEPPAEEFLMQNTLWPELQKLYGHGYELYSLAANKSGTILASACKATTQDHAEIILWNTENWKILQKLNSHKLTVTQMEFSPDGERLLSVSRDRRWTIFQNTPSSEGALNYLLVGTTDKNNGIHSRIIWCCSWTRDGDFFATGSRDGKVVVWRLSEEATTPSSSLGSYKEAATLEIKNESITALAFGIQKVNDSYILAIGLESGFIHLYTFNGSSFEFKTIINQSNAHHLSVNKLQFRPNTTVLQLASCGNDNTVRIYEIIP
ncbi:unnamed protein product [Diamesa tonsa]